MGLGTTQKLCDAASLSAELQYDVAGGEVKGLLGKPFFLRAGLSWKLANKCKLSSHLWARDTVHLTNKLECPLNATTKVVVSDQVALSTLGGGLKPTYNCGFTMEFKL